MVTKNINAEKIQGTLDGVSSISSTTISATTFYGDGSQLSGVQNYYTTGATLNGYTAYFDRNDSLSAYTLDLSSLSGIPDTNTFVTGFTYNENKFEITDNNGGIFNTTINTMTGLTVSGNLSATTFYGDGSQLTGISSNFTGGTVTGETIFTSGLSATTISATTISATTYQNLPPITIGVSLDGQRNVITTGSTGYRIVERGGNVTHWYVIADVTGSTIFDIKRNSVSIIGTGNKPTLSNQIRNNATPSSWTSISISANDELEFIVDSASTITKAWLYVQIT